MLDERPKIKMSREDTCPFLGDICKSNVLPVSFEQDRLSLRSYGVHSISKVLLSRRLNCSPLDIGFWLLNQQPSVTLPHCHLEI